MQPKKVFDPEAQNNTGTQFDLFTAHTKKYIFANKMKPKFKIVSIWEI